MRPPGIPGTHPQEVGFAGTLGSRRLVALAVGAACWSAVTQAPLWEEVFVCICRFLTLTGTREDLSCIIYNHDQKHPAHCPQIK